MLGKSRKLVSAFSPYSHTFADRDSNGCGCKPTYGAKVLSETVQSLRTVGFEALRVLEVATVPEQHSLKY